MKNPEVDTSFLPDRVREEKEFKEREELREHWTKSQNKIKAETITITFSYWDGSGHRFGHRAPSCNHGFYATPLL